MKRNLNLEVLISTMNRNDLSFLDRMFPDLNTSLYSILIVNQTQLQENLMSNNPKIRVINSREFGLSKSRNLAIKNAVGDILLIADDDIEYLPDFDTIILNAYKEYDEACLISFQYLNENKELVKAYPKEDGYLKSTKQYLTSFEITLKKDILKEYEICFDERFGLGAHFVCAEEQVVRLQILKNDLKVAFVSKPLCIHSGATSGSKLNSPENIEAMTAFKYIQYGNLVYLWLLKYVFFLYRHGFISFFEQLKAYGNGLEGIIKLKKLRDEN